MVNYTSEDMVSWYHRKILRIQHGNRIDNERYLTDEDVMKLFTGVVEIQEQLDGKLSNIPLENNRQLVAIDIAEKNAGHKHIIEYKDNNKSLIMLDTVRPTNSSGLYFESIYGGSAGPLAYATLILDKPALDVIYNILEVLSKLPSHFGSSEIKGLVIKNYRLQLMGKYVNEKFEDKLGL